MVNTIITTIMHHRHAHDHDHAIDHDHHGHHHAPGEACDHIVDARQLAGPFSWRKVMAVVFSVGIRPCTGAILVLVFAVTQGLFWAGVAATFAMAFGTAITVAVLATLALGSRELALKLGGANGRWANAVWTTCSHRRRSRHLPVRGAVCSPPRSGRRGRSNTGQFPSRTAAWPCGLIAQVMQGGFHGQDRRQENWHPRCRRLRAV